MNRANPHFLFLVAIVISTISGCASIPSDPDINGIWAGKMTPAKAPSNTFELGLSIDKKHVYVWAPYQDHWRQVKAGEFRANRYKSNAVIFATDSGNDEDGTWVETWTLTTTLLSKDEMLVEWVRVVNNIDKPKSSKDGKFSYGATGILRREK